MVNTDTGSLGASSQKARIHLLNQAISRREMASLLEQASQDQLLDLVSAKLPVHFESVRIGDDVVECLQLSDMEAYIDQRVQLSSPEAGIDSLPLWAKIWPAALPLALYMRRITPVPGERVLEIGAGLGISGLFAAKRGFSVVLSDVIPEALLFARINVLRNRLDDAVRVISLDITGTDHSERYDRIIGSEVLYRERYFAPLLHFFRTHLEPKPTAEILLSADTCRRSIKFFAAAKEFFQISRSVVTNLRESEEIHGPMGNSDNQTTYLYRLRPL